jgi:hypothetical protein
MDSAYGDAIVLAVGDRVLAWNDPSTDQELPYLGPYSVLVVGSATTQAVIRRASDANATTGMKSGILFQVDGAGALYESNYFQLQNDILPAGIDSDDVLLERITALPDWPGPPTDASLPASTGNAVIVTENRRIHALMSTGGYMALSDPDDSTTWLDGGLRPSFVQGRNMLVIAGGGAIQKWAGAGLSARLENTGLPGASDMGLLGYTGPGGDPPEATHVCGVAQRLLAKCANQSGQIWWSGPLEEYENWDMAYGGASFIQAAAKPDPLVALHDNTNEVFAFGELTLQVFDPTNTAVDSNDPTNTLDFSPNRTMNLGLIASDSVVPHDDNFVMLDRLRRFVLTDARTYNDISRNITQLLRDLGKVDDCWGFKMRFGRFDCLVWFFPTEGYGLIWDAQSGNWSEWRAWDRGPKKVTITSAYNWAEHDAFLLGLADGSIVKLDDTVTTDLGAPIEVELTSGFENHGTNAQKHTHMASFTFKRAFFPTANAGAGAPEGHVRIWCRDNEGKWRAIAYKVLSDGKSPCVQIRSLGVYRTRQWRVRYTGDDEFQLVKAEEELEVLGG